MKKLIIILVVLALTSVSFGELLCELNYQNGLVDHWDYYGPTAAAEVGSPPIVDGANWIVNEHGTPDPVPSPFVWKTIQGPGGPGDVAALMDGTKHTYIGLGAVTDRLLAGAIEMDIAPTLAGGAAGYEWLYTDDPTGDETNGIQGFFSLALNGSSLEATLLGNYGAVNDTLLTADVSSWTAGAWHNVRVEWDATVISLLIDDVQVAVDNAPSPFFASEGVKTSYAYLFGHGSGGGVKTFQGAADNVQVYNVIPEPATMALLGLGGMALLRRKRS
jgi:hypothetical protein